MTLFERVAEYLAQHDTATRRHLIDALDCDPRRLGEVLGTAVARGAIQKINDTPQRFRLIDGECKRVVPLTKPKAASKVINPRPGEPRQWFHI